MAGENREHLRFDGHYKPEQYTSPIKGRDKIDIADRNRNQHGNYLKKQLEAIKKKFEDFNEDDLPAGLVREDAIYVEFISDYNLELAFASLDDAKRQLVLLNIKRISSVVDGQSVSQYKAIVRITLGGVGTLLKKIEDYLTKNYRDTDQPRNKKLINNIQTIRLATIESFWASDDPFPDDATPVWWELWLIRNDFQKDLFEDAKVINQLELVGIKFNTRRLVFPEHIVRLVYGTAQQLAYSMLLLDNLAELRPAQEISEFFTRISSTEQADWIDEMTTRVVSETNERSVAVCILDTGVNNGHPLLRPFIPDRNLDSIEPSWGKFDGDRLGHGTQMSGLALFGDLTTSLVSRFPISLQHQLESIKIINKENPHPPEIYGRVTEEAVARATIMGPEKPRVFCMAVTAEGGFANGRPSSWSSAIDKITFSESTRSKYIFLVSSGNVFLNDHESYPDQNDTHSIEDPGQSFNTITVGAYTGKDTLDTALYPGVSAIASKDTMSPSNPTSFLWEPDWPIKPDIVQEGGNLGVSTDGLINDNIESLQLLTTNKDFRNRLLCLFGDTSGATALASRIAAMVYAQYPNFWPETVRGLMIHSAEWTSAMRGNKANDQLSKIDKIQMLKRYGYGVTSLQQALYSANNALTLIAERELQPFRNDNGAIKTNEMHVFELPWPTDVLMSLAENYAKVTITLSYFIEPNPGNKNYSSKYYYQSHGLRFKMNGPRETLSRFRKRVNKEARAEGENGNSGGGQENWLLGDLRNRGSIHKDIWTGTAADLATKNLIAIYPVNGWYRFRPKLNRVDSKVRYSLIVSVQTPGIETDIYTPVFNQIRVPISITT